LLSWARLSILILTSLLGWLVLSDEVTGVPTFTEQGAAVFLGLDILSESRSASLADIDNDGDLDVFFQGGGTGPTGAQQLLRNNFVEFGSLTFTNMTSTLPAGVSASWSAAWGDYNGDGYVDVFIGQSNTATGAVGDVFRNNGPAGFSNESVATNLDDPDFHQNEAWIDIDNDHDLDLLIGMEGPQKHQVYLQGPANQFTPVGAEVGFQQNLGWKGYGMAIGDTDDDGDFDVYISTCRSDNNIRNNFYENQLIETGSLSFIDIADSNGTQNMRNTYGAEFHDFDNDGKLDLFLVGADQQPSKIYRNDGDNIFTDVDTITGHPLLTDVGGDLNGGKPVDYDNDGDLDLFFHDHLMRSGTNKARKLYRNDGNWQFTDVTVAEGIHATNEGAYDSTWGDLDRDGDQDLIAPTNENFPERVFLSNASTNGNHWLYVELQGPSDNTTGIGASLFATLFAGTPQEVTLRREANTNAGTFNQSDLPVHFGLGTADIIDELQVRWPNGQMQTLFDVGVDQYLTITIPDPGDFDGDGDVDGRDFLVWQRNPSVGDLADWQGSFGVGATVGLSSSEVPEPGSLILLGIFTILTPHRRVMRSPGRDDRAI
jgi:hypothetical protein